MNRHAYLLCCAACSMLATAGMAPAQGPPPGAPAKLEPLPEIPSPPNLGDADLEPQITISQKDGDTVAEARINGRIVWIRVTPRHGRPYFLVPDGGGYTFIRRDSLDSGLKVPLWVLFSF
jgi:hypothetical protein